MIKTQTATEARIAHAGEDVERLQGQMSALSDKVETALLLREQVESFLSLQGPLAALRTDADTLRTQLERAGGERRPDADPARRCPYRPPAHHLPAGKLRSGLPGCHRQAGGRGPPGAVGRARRWSRSTRPRPRFPTSSTSWPCSRRWPTRSPRRPPCWSRSVRRLTGPRPRSPSSPAWTGSSTPGSAGRRSRSAGSVRSRPSSPK